MRKLQSYRTIATKFLVFAAVVLGIVWGLHQRNQLSQEVWSAIWNTTRPFSLLIFCILLIPANIGLEARKWQHCLRHVESMSFWFSFKAVLSGSALSFITPHGIGDYAGRILHLSEDKRLPAVGALLLCRLSQFYITLYIGTIALVYFIYFLLQSSDDQYWIFVPIVICLNILMLGLLRYRDSIFTAMIGKLKWKWLEKMLTPFIDFDSTELLRLFGLALLRHLVFCIQFSLLLSYMGIETHWFMFLMGTSFVFLAKSIIPTLLELGVREVTAVIFFGLLEDNHTLIISASLLLWITNLLLPAAAGSFLIFSWKKISLPTNDLRS